MQILVDRMVIDLGERIEVAETEVRKLANVPEDRDIWVDVPMSTSQKKFYKGERIFLGSDPTRVTQFRTAPTYI